MWIVFVYSVHTMLIWLVAATSLNWISAICSMIQQWLDFHSYDLVVPNILCIAIATNTGQNVTKQEQVYQ